MKPRITMANIREARDILDAVRSADEEVGPVCVKLENAFPQTHQLHKAAVKAYYVLRNLRNCLEAEIMNVLYRDPAHKAKYPDGFDFDDLEDVLLDEAP